MEFLKFLEKIRLPVFDVFFSLITHIGEETVFMAVALFIFWCVSKKNGYYVLGIGFIGTIINQFLKLVFRIPRPWVIDENFTIVESARAEATGYSFPSGHTQNAVGTFGAITRIFNKKWVKIASIVLCILVPFSRMYLGVHTPKDVFVSVLVALALIFILKPLVDKTDKNPNFMYVVLGIFFAFSLSLVLFCELYSFPSDIDEANLESGIKNAYTLLGSIVGLIISYPIEKKYIDFETGGAWYTQVFKLVFGLLILLGIKAALKPTLTLVFGSLGIAHAIRYMFVVIFAVCVWPLTFKLFRKLEEKIKKQGENK